MAILIDLETFARVAPLLTDRQAEVIRLRQQGYGAGRIGKILGIRSDTARELIHRAERRLHEVMGPA